MGVCVSKAHLPVARGESPRETKARIDESWGSPGAPLHFTGMGSPGIVWILPMRPVQGICQIVSTGRISSRSRHLRGVRGLFGPRRHSRLRRSYMEAEE